MIYRAKYVLPMTGEVIRCGEVMVSDGEIAAVGAGLCASHPNEEIVDLGDCILMPGFVNAHSHIEYTIARNRFDALKMWDWIDHVGFRRGKTPSSDTIYASAMIGAVDCVMTGVTCIGDSTFSGIAAKAADGLGLRGVVYLEVFGQSMGELYPWKFAEALDNAVKLEDRTSSRIRIGISPHSVYTSNREVLELCARSIGNMSIPVALHVSETEAEAECLRLGSGPIAEWRKRLGYQPMVGGKRPVRYLADVGLLRRGVCLAHCVDLSQEDISAVANSGASVAHCARSNAFLGCGIAPIAELRTLGAPIGIGTDSAASCHTMDFFEELRFVLGIHRAVAKDAEVITARSVLEMATVGGARALGLESIIGTLEPGKRADMIAVDAGESFDGEDIYLTVISRSACDVVMAMVDGAEIVKDGQLQGVNYDEHICKLKDCAGLCYVD